MRHARLKFCNLGFCPLKQSQKAISKGWFSLADQANPSEILSAFGLGRLVRFLWLKLEELAVSDEC